MKSESFGHKNAWFACRSDSPQAVAAALGLEELVSSSWVDGIQASYEPERRPSNEGWIFVTSPVDGWVMATGRALWTLCDSYPPTALGWCSKISQALEGAEVQYFSTYRVVDAHAWGRAINGVASRSYITVESEIREDFGSQSDEERSLGFNFFDFSSPEAEDESYADREDLDMPGEEDVMRLAAVWSVDPSQLEERGLEVQAGILGRLCLPEPNYVRTPQAVDTAVKSEIQTFPSQVRVSTASVENAPRSPWWHFW